MISPSFGRSFSGHARAAALWLVKPDVRAICGPVDYFKVQRLARRRDRRQTGSPVLVTADILSGVEVQLRPGSSDASVFIETFVGRFHEPPVGSCPRRIWDLGANIGLTSAHYAVLFPDALITAVEPQPYLAAVAQEHTHPWRSRCNVIEAAVWTEDGRLPFLVEPGDEYGGRVGDPRGSANLEVDSMCLNSLMQDDHVVDFVKMDIEGAERRLLSLNTEWTAKVLCIQVECHGDYSVDACCGDLTRLGFRAYPHPRHWASVVGLRDVKGSHGSA